MHNFEVSSRIFVFVFWDAFFCTFLKLDAHIFEIGPRSKDIGYSLALGTVSWIIQHLKHHFALNLKQILEQFFQNQFYSSLSYFNILKKTTLGYIHWGNYSNLKITVSRNEHNIDNWIFVFLHYLKTAYLDICVCVSVFEYWTSLIKFPSTNPGEIYYSQYVVVFKWTKPFYWPG